MIVARVLDEFLTPLEGVNIKIQNSNKGATTDSDGNFYLDASADDIVSFSYIGFETITIQSVDIPSEIILNEELEYLDQVVIKAKKKPNPKRNTGLWVGISLITISFLGALAASTRLKGLNGPVPSPTKVEL